MLGGGGRAWTGSATSDAGSADIGAGDVCLWPQARGLERVDALADVVL